MKQFVLCTECQRELGYPSFEPFFAPYYEDRTSYIECSRGHRSAVLIQNQKFEVLLESGATALAADFTLEAAASFSAALERFYEFCLKVFTVHLGLDYEVYESAFKAMSRQSERQLGAFLVLYALCQKRSYHPDQRVAEFRNRVIHKGLIPTPEEAEEFCSRVYAEIYKIYNDVKESTGSAIHKVVEQDLLTRRAAVEADMPVATTTGVGLFNIAHAEQEPTFEEAFARFKTMQSGLREAAPFFDALHAELTKLEKGSGKASKQTTSRNDSDTK